MFNTRVLSITSLALAASTFFAAAETLVIHNEDTAPSEIATLNVWVSAFQKGGDTWSDLTIPHDSGSSVTLGGLIAGGNPPDIIHSSDPGVFRDLKQLDQLLEVSEWAKTDKGKSAYEAMPDILRKVMNIDGQDVRIPQQLHIDGMICYNLAVASAAGVDPTSWNSFDDFYSDFDKIQTKGYIPLAFGADNFQLGYLFHALMADFAGEIYDRIYGFEPDRAAIDTPQFRKVLSEFRKIQQHTDAGATGRKWNDATNMVITGKALMQIQGDWIQGEFKSAGKVQGTDYSCMTFPGTGGVVLTVNTWGLIDTHNPSKTAAQYRFLDVNFDPEVQLQGALTKGNAPVRADLDVSKLNPWTQEVLKLLEKPDFVYLTPSLTVDQDWKGAIWDTASKFWTDPNMTEDQAVEVLQKAYDQVF